MDITHTPAWQKAVEELAYGLHDDDTFGKGDWDHMRASTKLAYLAAAERELLRMRDMVLAALTESAEPLTEESEEYKAAVAAADSFDDGMLLEILNAIRAPLLARIQALDEELYNTKEYLRTAKEHGTEMLRQRDEALARIQALEAENAHGWFYFNEDAGTEWCANHPVDSGEVPDATDVRPATAEAAVKELKHAWEAWRQDLAELAPAAEECSRALRQRDAAIEALNWVLKIGRGPSGRIIIERHEEQELWDKMSVLAASQPAQETTKIPCPYCRNVFTGLPGNACENCMNTGEIAALAETE